MVERNLKRRTSMKKTAAVAAESRASAAPEGAETRSEPPDARPTFEFRTMIVTRLVVEEVVSDLAPVLKGEDRQRKYDSNIGVTAQAHVADDGSECRLTLTLKVVPDQRVKPYRIELTVEGSFGGKNVTAEQMFRFCRVNAPALLFPYIREIIDRSTSDGRYGRVRLAPLNMAMLLDTSPSSWRQSPEGSDSTPKADGQDQG